MKKYLVLLIAVLSFNLALAQAPEMFAYQGVARQSGGLPLANEAITVKISLLEGNTDKYVETHNVTTNKFGLYSLQIGDGSVNSGDFSTVNWGTSQVFVKVAINGADIGGAQQLLSVPYALYAKSSGSGGGTGTENIITKIEIVNNVLSITEGTNTKTVSLADYKELPTPTSEGYLFYNTTTSVWEVKTITGGGTDSQGLSVVGSDLQISNGNSVPLSSLQISELPTTANPNDVLTWNGTAWEATGGTNTDDQQLTLVSDELRLEDGGTVDLSKYNDLPDVTTTDNDKVLKVKNGVWALGNDDGGLLGADDQSVTLFNLNGTDLELTLENDINGKKIVDLSSLKDGVDDADADPNNELQSVGTLTNVDTTNVGANSILKWDDATKMWVVGADNVGSGGSPYSGGAGITIDGSNVISSTITDTKLTEVEVDAFVNNNGYLKNELDADPNNELQSVGTLTNVDTISAALVDGNVLKWDATKNKWLPKTDDVGAGGVATLGAGQILIGDGNSNSAGLVGGDVKLTGSNFEIQDGSVDLGDLESPAGVSEGDFIVYQGGKWIYKTVTSTGNTDNQNLTISNDSLVISGGDGILLSDLPKELPATTSTDDGKVLTWDQAASKWIAKVSASTIDTDNQNLTISNDSLVISGGDGILLSDLPKELPANGPEKSILVTNATKTVEWYEPNTNNILLGTNETGELSAISVGNGLTHNGIGVGFGGDLSGDTKLSLNGKKLLFEGSGQEVASFQDVNFQINQGANSVFEVKTEIPPFTTAAPEVIIGSEQPVKLKLEILGTPTGSGNVLTSAPDGYAYWQAPSSSSLWTKEGATDNIGYGAGNVGIGTAPTDISRLEVYSGDITSGVNFTRGMYIYNNSQIPTTTNKGLQVDVNGAAGNVYGVEVGVTQEVGSEATAFRSYMSPRGDKNSYILRGQVSLAESPTGENYGIYMTGEPQNFFSGKVGIGTSTPEEKLDVNGAIRLAQLTADPSDNNDRLYNKSGDLYWNGSQISGGSNPWAYGPSSSVYYNSGTVGIGVNDPSSIITGAKLHVKTGTGLGIVVQTDTVLAPCIQATNATPGGIALMTSGSLTFNNLGPSTSNTQVLTLNASNSVETRTLNPIAFSGIETITDKNVPVYDQSIKKFVDSPIKIDGDNVIVGIVLNPTGVNEKLMVYGNTKTKGLILEEETQADINTNTSSFMVVTATAVDVNNISTPKVGQMLIIRPSNNQSLEVTGLKGSDVNVQPGKAIMIIYGSDDKWHHVF